MYAVVNKASSVSSRRRLRMHSHRSALEACTKSELYTFGFLYLYIHLATHTHAYTCMHTVPYIHIIVTLSQSFAEFIVRTCPIPFSFLPYRFTYSINLNRCSKHLSACLPMFICRSIRLFHYSLRLFHRLPVYSLMLYKLLDDFNTKPVYSVCVGKVSVTLNLSLNTITGREHKIV